VSRTRHFKVKLRKREKKLPKRGGCTRLGKWGIFGLEGELTGTWEVHSKQGERKGKKPQP